MILHTPFMRKTAKVYWGCCKINSHQPTMFQKCWLLDKTGDLEGQGKRMMWCESMKAISFVKRCRPPDKNRTPWKLSLSKKMSTTSSKPILGVWISTKVVPKEIFYCLRQRHKIRCIDHHFHSTRWEILSRITAIHWVGVVEVLHPSKTISNFLEIVGFLDQDRYLLKLTKYYFWVVLDSCRHSKCR